MFAATPRLRDLLDVRTVVLVVLIALGAFGLQLVFLAGTVASPLGGALAAFDRVPQVERAPVQAVAGADAGRGALPDVTGEAHLPWERPTAAGVASGELPPECLVYR